jgi:phage tail protein X
MFYRRAQAAMEFLTTYGWTFLAIILAVAGLSYFGVFDIGRVLPDGCVIESPDLTCGDIFLLDNNGPSDNNHDELVLTLTNNARQAMNLTEVRIVEKSLPEDNFCVTTGSNNPLQLDVEGTSGSTSVILNPGTTYSLYANLIDGSGRSNIAACGITPNVGQKKTFDFEIDYTLGNSAIQKVATGTLTTTVRA